MKPVLDADAIQATIRRALEAAGLDPASGPLREAGETIRRALAGAGVAGVGAGVGSGRPAAAAPPAPGRLESHRFGHPAGSLRYKLHRPAGVGAAPPLLLMLHGCTQSADDFAAGTRMNRLADEAGLLVLYPEQDVEANPSRCWNWFRPQDQQRGAGEAALLAALVREIAQRHGADPRRLFVAGLSAGAAMAVVLGETHPELFAGIGVHSGLPFASAHDTPSALAAMKGGRSGLPGLQAAAAAVARRQATQPVPTIVFHGDRDPIVQPVNGEQVVQQATAAWVAASAQPMSTGTTTGTTAGRRYTRSVLADARGAVRVESWVLHGAGHAWSGGDASGSHVDPSGPDASAEMLRFFLSLPVEADD